MPSSLHSTLGVHLSLPPPSRVVLTRIWWWGTTRGALVFLFSDFVCALVCVVQVLRFLFFFFLMLIREQNPNFRKQYLIFKKWSGCDPALKLLVLKSPWMSCRQSYCRDMALKLTTVCGGNLRWQPKKWVCLCRMNEFRQLYPRLVEGAICLKCLPVLFFKWKLFPNLNT